MNVRHAKRIIKADEKAYIIGWVTILLGFMGTILLWNRPNEITVDDYGIIKLTAYGALTVGWVLMEKMLSKRHFIVLPALASLIFIFVEHDFQLLGGKIMGVLIGAFIAYVKLGSVPNDQLVEEAKAVIAASRPHLDRFNADLWS